MTSSAPFTLVPGLSLNVNVPANSFVLITTDGTIKTTSLSSSGASAVLIGLAVDGNNGGTQAVITVNNASAGGTGASWSMSRVMALSAGAHIIQVIAAGGGAGSDAIVSGGSGDIMQGSLSAVILKQ